MTLAADPAASAERLKQLSAASDEARRLIAEAVSAQAELAKTRAELDTRLKTEREAHDAKLAPDRKGFDDECRGGYGDGKRKPAKANG